MFILHQFPHPQSRVGYEGQVHAFARIEVKHDLISSLDVVDRRIPWVQLYGIKAACERYEAVDSIHPDADTFPALPLLDGCCAHLPEPEAACACGRRLCYRRAAPT